VELHTWFVSGIPEHTQRAHLFFLYQFLTFIMKDLLSLFMFKILLKL
jgi:hypothetical protein